MTIWYGRRGLSRYRTHRRFAGFHGPSTWPATGCSLIEMAIRGAIIAHLVPINSDFDFYRMDSDGQSVTSLTAPASREDIVQANNGGYIGLASAYEHAARP